jgi:outer membrane biosynthesis protein TonB
LLRGRNKWGARVNIDKSELASHFLALVLSCTAAFLVLTSHAPLPLIIATPGSFEFSIDQLETSPPEAEPTPKVELPPDPLPEPPKLEQISEPQTIALPEATEPDLPEPPKTVQPKPSIDPQPKTPRHSAAQVKAEPAPTRQQASSAAAASVAAAFRSCLAASPYPQSKDARLQKPSGVVGISISAGAVTVAQSSGSSILDSAARARAVACAETAGSGSLSGFINYIPR